MTQPVLKALHDESTLVPSKLSELGKLATEVIVASLACGGAGALKTRPDGTILDGHHRIHLLRKRGYPVDSLPREVMSRDPELEES